MISPRDPHVPRMLRYIDRPLALLLLFDIVVVVAYVYLEQRWLALPNLPLSIGGGALGVSSNFTRWSVIKDLRNRVLYFRGYNSHAFRAIHLQSWTCDRMRRGSRSPCRWVAGSLTSRETSSAERGVASLDYTHGPDRQGGLRRRIGRTPTLTGPISSGPVGDAHISRRDYGYYTIQAGS